MPAGKVDVVITANGVQYTKTLEAAGRAARQFGRDQAKMGEAAEGMRLRVVESLSGVTDKLAETAEKAELSTDGIAAGFSGLAGLIGGGALAGAVAHMLDGLAELNVELGDVHDTTGISMQSLAGLHQLAREMGLDFQPIVMGLTRMQRAQVSAIEGMKEYRLAFQDLGLTMKDLQTLTPEQLLYRVSAAMQDAKLQAVRANSALEIFGRGGKTLIPILQEQGGALQALLEKEGAYTGITDRSRDAARAWTEECARLSAVLHRQLIPVLDHIVPVVEAIDLAFRAVGDSIAVLGLGIEEFTEHTTAALSDLARAAVDGARGQWSQLIADSKAAGHEIRDAWQATGAGIKSDWAALTGQAGQIHWNAPALDDATRRPPADLSGLLDEDLRGRARAAAAPPMIDLRGSTPIERAEAAEAKAQAQLQSRAWAPGSLHAQLPAAMPGLPASTDTVAAGGLAAVMVQISGSAIGEMVDRWNQMAMQIEQVSARAIDGFNAATVHAMMGGKHPGAAFGQVFEGAGKSIMGAVLGKLEATGLHKLGIGGKADGSEISPFWVRMWGANLTGGMPSGVGGGWGKIASEAKSVGGSILGDIGHIFQGHFAVGGSVVPGMAALVGEQGPELFVPRSAGTIVPNGQFGGSQHVYHIDARGANDPAAVHAAVARALPHAVAASMQAQHDHARRTPHKR